MNDDTEMYDCIYDDAHKDAVQAAFPHAIIEDESDYIHEGRFSVRLPREQKREWFKWLVTSGVARLSLMFGLAMRMQPKEIEAVLDEVKPGWRPAPPTRPKADDDALVGLKGPPPDGPLTRQGVRDLNARRRT